MYDVIIVGGGVAGLSAALVLGRAGRRVQVIDAGQPRNAPAAGAHSFFSRDGTPPARLLEIGREQLRPYDSVEFRPGEVVAARRLDDGFAVTLNDGAELRARTLLLATGVRDDLPDIPGFREFWARGVYHCPYCHGWEVRDQPLAVYANGETASHLAPLVRNWSRDLVLLTDGPADLPATERARFDALGIRRRDDRIARLEGGDCLERIVFAGGDTLARAGLFIRPAQRPRAELAAQLGCALVEDSPIPGLIRVDERQQTTVPGVYAAGDVATNLQQIVTAAATGATAAAMINFALVQQETAAGADES